METPARNRPPLADRMRPETIDEIVGQSVLVGPGKPLRRQIETDQIPSLIFWGPPGSGKTTLARVIARQTKARFHFLSAVLSGVKEAKEIIELAKQVRKFEGKRTILFIDEIHRWNKAQQDALLPHVEDGTITLIGATTENPSFGVIGTLLSRTKVYVLNPLSEDELAVIVKRALTDAERGLGKLNLKIEEKALQYICETSDGDARRALNTLEIAASLVGKSEEQHRRVARGTPPLVGGDVPKGQRGRIEAPAARTVRSTAGVVPSQDPSAAEPARPDKRLVITLETVEQALQKKALLYDKAGEEHYNLISAFIKSMRGSDPDAAVYYLARMLEAGEDPLFLARRMVIFASEDVGNADPQAIQVAVSAMQAFDFVGMPEGWIPLAQAATYLASAPKSKASYRAYLKAKEDVEKEGVLPTPLPLRNAPTPLMKELGYGKGPSIEGGYLPEKLRGRRYYEPPERG